LSARQGRGHGIGVVSGATALFLVLGLLAWATNPSTSSMRGLGGRHAHIVQVVAGVAALSPLLQGVCTRCFGDR
jgi:hypothetical protein